MSRSLAHHELEPGWDLLQEGGRGRKDGTQCMYLLNCLQRYLQTEQLYNTPPLNAVLPDKMFLQNLPSILVAHNLEVSGTLGIVVSRTPTNATTATRR